MNHLPGVESWSTGAGQLDVLAYLSLYLAGRSLNGVAVLANLVEEVILGFLEHWQRQRNAS